MRAALLLLVVLLLAGVPRAGALDLKPCSVSSSKQFVVYCSNATLRGRVAGFAEEVKSEVLSLLGEGDRWKFPVVISLERAASPRIVPVNVQLIETPDGTTVQMDVQIGDDPAAVNLQRHLVRAVLLEYAYRDRPGVLGGERYVEAPWWMIDGAVQLMRRRSTGPEADLFRRIIATNRVPPIAEFLTLKAGDIGAAAQAVDAACAMCLVQLLIELPGGRANLARLVRRWPDMCEDPMGALRKDFPSLGTETGELQKWWTLNLARFSATDRYQGLSAAETDKELSALLQFELPVNKRGDKKTFAVAEYREFIKLPASRAAMRALQNSTVVLSARANSVFRPVISGYERIFALLARGKTRGIDARLENVERYREAVLHRIDDIADYLNWFEATQFAGRSDAFESFVRLSPGVSASEQSARRSDPISEYLDQLQQEF